MLGIFCWPMWSESQGARCRLITASVKLGSSSSLNCVKKRSAPSNSATRAPSRARRRLSPEALAAAASPLGCWFNPAASSICS